MVSNEKLLAQLHAAVAPHDTLLHPYYRAWTMGTLTRADLRAYAAQYLHQVEGLPGLIAAALAKAGDAETRACLQRNLAEECGSAAPEQGQPVAHRELWLRFAEGLGAVRPELDVAPAAETAASGKALRALVAEGEVEALAALWAYEAQTARVSAEKRRGLIEQYGVTDGSATEFFALHEALDVHHAADIQAALSRAVARAGERGVERACSAARRSAQAQWLFLDGAERARAAA